jgi:hypothetical protein
MDLEEMEKVHCPCRKCYPSRMPLKSGSATTSTTRAKPATGCNNVTYSVAGEITIRQPQGTKLHQRFFSPGKRLRAPQIHSRIQKLQPHLPFLLRSWCADPYHVAPRNIQRVFVWNDFDNLSAFQSESAHESEPLWRAIEYEAGKPFRDSFKIDDKTGALFQDNPL